MVSGQPGVVMHEPEWVSLREFSRRRDVSLAAVQKAIADGRVPASAVKRDEAGRLVAVDYQGGMQAWNDRTDPAQASRTGHGPVTPGAAPGGEGVLALTPPKSGESGTEDAETPAAAPVEKDHGYYEARARREQIQAQQAELDYAESLGLVVSVEDERQVKSRRYRAIRDQMLSIPDRIATLVAAERDPARVHVIMTDEIKRVLHGLSEDARAEAAGGTAERVAA